MANKQYSLADIKELKTRYHDPAKYLDDDWSGTLTDLLGDASSLMGDKAWAVLRLLPDEICRQIAIDTARRRLHWFREAYCGDRRPLKAIQAACDFIDGRCDLSKMEEAGQAASAARDIAFNDHMTASRWYMVCATWIREKEPETSEYQEAKETAGKWRDKWERAERAAMLASVACREHAPRAAEAAEWFSGIGYTIERLREYAFQF